MTTDRLPPLLALARDWKAEGDGCVWRDAAWCHALLVRGQSSAALVWLTAVLHARIGESIPTSLPPSAGCEAEAVAVDLLHRLRSTG